MPSKFHYVFGKSATWGIIIDVTADWAPQSTGPSAGCGIH